jgi:LruC domain-containing protein
LFEDLWPATGDYDFNDLVADLRINFIKDAQNRTKEMTMNWTIKAIGGYQQNGLLVQLPFPSNKIESVNGFEKYDSYIRLQANGTEDETETAVFIISDNLSKSLPAPSGYLVTNVLDEQPMVNPKTISVTIVFSTALTDIELGSAPFDPFLVANLDRGREIHLKGKNPTNRADPSYFGKDQDGGTQNASTTYSTRTGLPWVLQISSAIPHPKENNDFTEAYLHFSKWVESSGAIFGDWFQNKTNYRNTSKLYLKN